MSTSNKNAAEEELAVRPTMLERRPLRPFKSSEEYLYAMKEDLADWLTTLYELDIGADTFLEALETGVVLCRHANNVRRMALEYSGRMTYPIPDREVTYRADVAPGTFQARDNVSNFIWWCRALGIYECLLFETDDLVLRKNEKSFILCLLEVARRGSKVGMLAPLLVQMEEEIDREIAAEESARIRAETSMTEETTEAITPEVIDVPWQPPVQIITNDLKNLDEMVRDLVNRCTCPFQFPMIRVSEGKYRIGDTKLLIYVRILRSHVMVRVGGGWDTLAHFLDKHDPCRCRQGHRAPLSSKLTVKFGGANCPAQTQMEVTYQRSSVPISPSAHCSPFVPPRQRSVSPMPTSMQPASPTRQRRNSTSSSSSSSHKLSNGSLASLPGDRSSSSSTSSATAVVISTPSSTTGTPSINQTTSVNGGGAVTTCDSSSEYSDDGYKSGSRIPTIHAIKKYSPKKLLKLTENGGGGVGVEGTSENGESDENPDMSPRDSLLGEEEDDDDDVDATSSPLPDNHHPDVVPANGATSRKPQQDVQCRKPATVADEKSRRCSVGQASSNRARRLSGDVIPAMYHHQHQTARRMPRSRSQSSEVSDGSAMAGGGGFARNQTGRYSYRNPQLLSEQQRYRSATTPDKNNTWSFRSRSSRPSMGVDLFLAGDDSRSPSTSPQRRQRNVNVNGSGPRSLQASPSKHYAPLLQQMLADVALDSDDKVLRRMATILRQRKMSAPSPCPIAVPDDDTGTGTPDSESELGLEPVARLLKVSPRKDNYPQSGSKIPVPTFY